MVRTRRSTLVDEDPGASTSTAPPPQPPPQRAPSEDVGNPEVDEDEVNENCNKFLTIRSPTNRNGADKDYHDFHRKANLARIPPLRPYPIVEDDDDNEEEDDEDEVKQEEMLIMAPPTRGVLEEDEEDMKTLRRKTSHLPDDVVFRLLYFCNYDVPKTITMAEDMRLPDLVPPSVKNIIRANIAMERDAFPNRRRAKKKFHFEDLFKGSADTKSLVDFYYREKNKMMGNWRLGIYDLEDSQEEWIETAQKRQEAGIQMITAHPSSVRRRTPLNKPRSARTRARGTPVRLPDDQPGPSTSSILSHQPSTSTGSRIPTRSTLDLSSSSSPGLSRQEESESGVEDSEEAGPSTRGSPKKRRRQESETEEGQSTSGPSPKRQNRFNGHY